MHPCMRYVVCMYLHVICLPVCVLRVSVNDDSLSRLIPSPQDVLHFLFQKTRSKPADIFANSSTGSRMGALADGKKKVQHTSLSGLDAEERDKHKARDGQKTTTPPSDTH